MSQEETEEQRERRLAAEREERERNQRPPKKKNENSNELVSGDENDNDDDINDNKNDTLTTNGLGVDTNDDMDGLEPPLAKVPGKRGKGDKLGRRNDITGKKRQLVETSNNFDELTKKFLNNEISQKNYMAIIATMKTHGSMNSSKSGSRSRRSGGKRSSIVCLLFPFFLFFCCGECSFFDVHVCFLFFLV